MTLLKEMVKDLDEAANALWTTGHRRLANAVRGASAAFQLDGQVSTGFTRLEQIEILQRVAQYRDGRVDRGGLIDHLDRIANPTHAAHLEKNLNEQ